MNIPFGVILVGGLCGVAILLFVIDRVLLWMERRGWIAWRSFNPGIKSAARGTLNVFHEIVEPEVRDVQEEQRQRAEATPDRADPSDR
jgi:hypothetical protein